MLVEARLENANDGQWRRRVVEAASVEDARAEIARREANRTAYSLLDRRPIEQIVERKHAKGVHATISLDRFAGTGMGGSDLLTHVERDHYVDKDGRVHGPNVGYRAHLQAHYQEAPYQISDIKPFEPNVAQIITALKQLQEHPKAWDKAIKRMRDEGISTNVVTASLFGLQSQKQIDGSAPIVWSSATIKLGLTTSAWTPNQDTHDFEDDVTNEVAGTGYTAGGVTLGSKTSTYDTASDQTRLDAADASWAGSTLTARRAFLWNDTAGAASTDPLIGWIDFGADVSTTAGTFQITFDATGIQVYDVS